MRCGTALVWKSSKKPSNADMQAVTSLKHLHEHANVDLHTIVHATLSHKSTHDITYRLELLGKLFCV